MPFLEKKCENIRKIKSNVFKSFRLVILRDSLTPNTMKKTKSIHIPPTQFPPKRVSLSALERGSMTVEAALAVPIFLFAMVNVLSMFLFFKTFSENLSSLHQQARELSMHAYAGQQVGLEGGLIKLTKIERVKPVIPVFGWPGTIIANSCCMHPWTGYDVTGNSSSTQATEEMVYVTKNGTVYHKDRSCSYLNPSIRSVKREDVETLRNNSREKYYPCESCEDSSSMVYITNDGNRYHTKVSCSGLKRTIYCIPLSETEGRAPCSKCSR